MKFDIFLIMMKKCRIWAMHIHICIPVFTPQAKQLLHIGIGLLSIASTAEKYGGTAEFSHEGNQFYTDIMIPMSNAWDS